MTTRCIRCGKDLQGMAQMCDDCIALKEAEEAQLRARTPSTPTATTPAAGAAAAGAPRQCVCGQWIPAGAAFCPVCGRSTGAGALQYAGFWMRFAAVFIDGIILGIVQVVLSILISDAAARGGLNFFIGLGYTLGFWIAEGATPGKMAMGVKIVTTNGEPISGGQAVGRYFAQILSALLLGIGLLMIAWTPQKRGLHDYLAGTVVIKTR